MIDTHSIKTPINAADYAKLALPIIDDIHARDKNVILVGGSGFYLQALLHGMYESETTNNETLQKSDELYQKEGISPFALILKENDLSSFEKYHINDHYRIRRAVEHFWMTGDKFSKARLDMLEKKRESPYQRADWNIHFIYLDIPKDKHQEVIELRAQTMVKQGLVEEVQSLLTQGFTLEHKPLKSIGYKETIDYINGIYTNKEEYLERLVINTRQLAKAQRTWFKKIERNEYDFLQDKNLIKENLSIFLQDKS